MGIPVMQIAIKRCTDANSSAIAYNIFYVTMNLAAMFAAPFSDYIRINYKSGLTINQYGTEMTLSSYRLI